MLVNVLSENEVTQHVKFVSYTGKWPSRCIGTLTLEIDGQKYTFGQSKPLFSSDKGPFADFTSFWESGGECPLYGEITQEEWKIDYNLIPEQFKKYASEIDKVFNDNVEWGCCGGCR